MSITQSEMEAAHARWSSLVAISRRIQRQGIFGAARNFFFRSIGHSLWL